MDFYSSSRRSLPGMSRAAALDQSPPDVGLGRQTFECCAAVRSTGPQNDQLDLLVKPRRVVLKPHAHVFLIASALKSESHGDLFTLGIGLSVTVRNRGAWRRSP
jgi:hypothetical protein